MATSFSDACREQGRVPGAKMLYAGYENATEADIRDMQLEEGARVVCLRRGCATRTGCPSPSRRTGFPERYNFLLDEDLTDRSLLETLETKYGIKFYVTHRTIELVYASHSTARLLNCSVKDAAPCTS